MSNFIILISCLCCGLILRRSQRFPPESYKLLGQIIINFALPALSIVSIHKLVWNPELVEAIAMPWMLFFLSFGFFAALGRRAGWSRETIGTLILLGGVGNTSFVGIPILQAMYGPSAIPVAILIDQAGSYLVLSMLGLATAAHFVGGQRTSVAGVLRKALAYPPFIAMVAGFALIPVDIPPYLNDLLVAFGQTVVPLALISVGMQLSLKGMGDDLRPLVAGLVFKLLLAPLLTAMALLLLGGGALDATQGMIVLESAMGPSIAASVVASQQGLNQRLGALMLGIGIPLCIATTAGIYALLRIVS